MPASSLLAPNERPGKNAVLSSCVCVEGREREGVGGERGREEEEEGRSQRRMREGGSEGGMEGGREGDFTEIVYVKI